MHHVEGYETNGTAQESLSSLLKPCSHTQLREKEMGRALLPAHHRCKEAQLPAMTSPSQQGCSAQLLEHFNISSPHRAVSLPPSLDPLDFSPPGQRAQPQRTLAKHTQLSPASKGRPTSIKPSYLPAPPSRQQSRGWSMIGPCAR